MFSGPFEVYFFFKFFFIVIKKLTNKKPSMRTSYLVVLVAIPVTYFRLTVKVGGFEKEKKPTTDEFSSLTLLTKVTLQMMY